jgi:LysM repeat protein
MHFVKSGETLTGIAQTYNVTVVELTAENPGIEKGLKADMVLRIPEKPVAEIPAATVPNTEKPAVQAKPVITPKEAVAPAVILKEAVKPTVAPKEIVAPAVTQKDPATPNLHKEPVKPAVTQKVPVIPTGEADYLIYTVKKQETFYGISKQFNVTVDDIRNANPDIVALQDGMEIKIPKQKVANKTAPVAAPVEKTPKAGNTPDSVLVKTGETLYSIAKANNTTVDELIALNPELSGGLKAGMVIRLHKPAVVKGESKIEPKSAEVPKTAATKQDKPTDCYSPDYIKNTYQVALLLPFALDDTTNVLEASEQKSPSEFDAFNYFQFYAGFMLAADSLKSLGLHARIQVLDADRLSDTLKIRQTLRKPGMDKMDLLVGPMYATSFKIAARFAEKNKIGIINPLSRRESIVEGNPYVIKAQVSGEGISAKLSAFISRNYPSANIIVVRNDKKELKSLADGFMAQTRANISAHSFSGTLQESVFTTDKIAGVKSKIKPGVKNIVIFFSNSKANVPNFVSLLNPSSKSEDIILIGMDGWEELELETEFLVNLNFHQLTSSYIDYESEAVKQFIARFHAKYGAVPLSAQHAFLGFDTGWYFLTSLMWYGDKYMDCLPGHKGEGLQFNFSFAPAEKDHGLQNQDVTIVKLQDYKMVKAE